MYISRLEVRDLRILSSVSMQPSPGLNLVVGPNAAGKSSLLEALHMLGTGRSFRTRHLGQVVRKGALGFRVFGEVVSEEGRSVGLGLARDGEQLVVRVDGERASAGSQLARELVVAVIRPESHRLVSGGPAERRRLLDWGLFHVEQAYHSVLQRYMQALRQRNAALRGQEKSLGSWEQELTVWGERVSRFREAYVGEVAPYVKSLTRRLLTQDVEIRYRRGWREGSGLDEALARSRERDRQLGVTSVGPHRADLDLDVDGMPLAEALSRGQEKLLVGTMILGQVAQIKAETGREAVMLVDDLPSELDTENRCRFLRTVAGTGGQAFISSVADGLNGLDGWTDRRVFHVERGKIKHMV